MPDDVDGAGLDLWVPAGDGDGGGEGAVDGEDDGLRARGDDAEVGVEHGVVAADHHADGVDAVAHGVMVRKGVGDLILERKEMFCALFFSTGF